MSLARKALVGSLWTSGVNYISQGVGFICQAILGRLLLESDFGLFATINSIIQLIFIISSFSFNISIIQTQENREHLISTAFLLTGILSLISFILAGTALSIFSFYRHLSQTEILIFTILLFINITNLYGQIFDAILQRQLEFKKISLVSVTTNLLNPIVAVSCAFAGLGVWSLIYGQMTAAFFFLVGNFVLSKWKFSLKFSTVTAKWYLSMGWKYLSSRTLEVVYSQLDRLIIKSMNSYDQVGIYDKANLASLYPSRIVSPTILNVALPVYSKLHQDQERLTQAYTIVNYFLIRVLVPFAIIFVLIPDYFMSGVFGNRWITAAPVLRVLSLFAFLHPIVENMRVIFYSLGKPEEVARVRLLQIIIFVPSIIILVFWFGIIGAAYSLLISLVVAFIRFAVKVRNNIDLSFRRLVLFPFLNCCIIIVISFFVPFPRIYNPIIGLVIFSLAIFIAYGIIALAFEKKTIFNYLLYLKDLLKSPATE